MIIIERVDQLREALRRYRSPAFAPTMGNLHEGHLSLIARAKSSRNGYLSAEQRRDAVALSSALAQVAAAVQAGESELERLSQQAMQQLRELGWQPDYLSVRRQADLLEPASCDDALVVLGAARLGSTRLIDNILFTR